MFEALYGITIVLFAWTSAVSILALHSDRSVLGERAQALFFISTAGFIVSGVVRYYPFSAGDFMHVLASIWGYFFLLATFLLVLLVYLRFSRWRQYWKSIAPISLLFVTVLLVVSVPFINSTRHMQIDLVHGLLPVHVVLAIVGELFFFFSFVGGVLSVVMERQLRKKSSMIFIYRLPNLETIEKFNMWATCRSLVFLTAGLGVGVVLLWGSFNVVSLFSLKEIIIYVSWALILALYVLRSRNLLTAYRINYLTILSFIIVMSLYVYSNIAIQSGFHSFK